MANDDVANQPFSKIAFRNYEVQSKTAQNVIIRRLQNRLAQGLVLGESIDLIQRRVKSEMMHTSMWQARRIARTETLRTANRGRWPASQQAIEEFDLPTKKEWITTNDERTRDMHAAMSGQRVRHDEMFVLPNGEGTRFPLDSSLSENSINCRCMHAYVLDMEALGVDNDEDYNRPVDKSRDISHTRLYQKAHEENTARSSEPIPGSGDLRKAGEINLEHYRGIFDLKNNEVIITNERIEHIKERHPGDHKRFAKYIPQVLSEADYIIEANKPDSVMLLKSIDSTHFSLILRLKTANDPEEYKNLIITFMKISSRKYAKALRNKKILYKR